MVRFSGNKIEMQNITWIKIKEIWSHVGFQKYLKNTGWMFFGRVFVLFLSFFIGIYTARYLGPERYGVLNYVISFVGLFSFIPGLGINSILSREIIKHPEKRDDLMGTAFFLQIFGSLLGIFCIAFFVFFVLAGNPTLNFGIILVASTFILQALNVIDIYFQSNVMAKKVVIIQMTSFLFSSLLKVLFIYLGLGLTYFVSLYVFDAVFLAIGLLYIYKKNNFFILKWNFNKEMAMVLLKESWPLMLSTSFFLIYSRIDQVMIKQMMDNYSVGIYSVSAKLSEAWIFIPSAIVGSLFTAIVNAKKTNHELYENRFKKLYALIFYLSFAISLGIFLLAKPIVHLLFGPEYFGAITSLQIYVWSGIATAMGFVISNYLIVEGKTKILFFINFLSMASNILLNLILIPKMGIPGAALATLISYYMMVFAIGFFRSTRGHLLLIGKSLLIK
jgi:O-antigen/teichoic acid export membrane protein